MKKRLLALLVAFAMIVSMLPVQVLAADGAEADSSVPAQSDVSAPQAQEAEAEASEAEEASEPAPQAEESAPEAKVQESEAEPEAEPAPAAEPEAESAPAAEAEPAAEAAPAAEAEPAAESELAPQDGAVLLKDRIQSIQVGGIWRFSSDCCEPDDNGFCRVDCWPGDYNLTITLNNGAVFILGAKPEEGAVDGATYCKDWDDVPNAIASALNMADGSVELYWRSDESKEAPWGLGGHQAQIVLRGNDEGDEDAFVQPYDVHVVAFSKLECGNITRSVYNRVRNDENPDDVYNGKVECWPDWFKATITDGTAQKEFDSRSDAYKNEGGDLDMDKFCAAIETAYPGLRIYGFDWWSDEITGQSWEAGNHQAQFFCWAYWDGESHSSTDPNALATYTVDVTDKTPLDQAGVQEVRVNDFTILDSQKDEMWDDNGNWWRLDCTPRDENAITVTMENGETKSGNVWNVSDWLQGKCGQKVDLWWDTAEKKGDNWSAENHPEVKATLTAHFQDGDYEVELCTYTVNVKTNPIKSIKADDIEVFWTHWDWEQCNDDQANHNHNQWKRLDCWPEKITVTLTDGSALAGDPETVCRQLAEKAGVSDLDRGWSSEQEENESQWYHREVPAGSAIKAWFDICGVVSDPYTVTATENPIQNLTVSPISRFTNDLDHQDWYEGQQVEWNRIDCWPDEVEVTTAQGKCKGDPEEVENWLREKYGYGDFGSWDGTRSGWESEERPAVGGQAAVTWGVGKHEQGAEFFFGGFQGVKYDVDVVQALAVTIDEIRPVNRLVNDREWCEKVPAGEEDEEDFDRVSAAPEYIKATVAGKTYEGDPWAVRDQIAEAHPGARVRVEWDSDELPVWSDEDRNWVGSWSAGAHTATLTLMGTSRDYPVQVVAPEDVIASVTADDFKKYENDRFTTWDDDQPEWQKLDCTPDHVVVTLKDGTVFDSDEKNAEGEKKYDSVGGLVDAVEEYLRDKYPGIHVGWGWDSDEKPGERGADGKRIGTYTAGNSYPVRFEVAGMEVSCKVTVVASPKVENLKVQSNNVVYRFMDDREDIWKDDIHFRRVNAAPTFISVTVGGKDYDGNPWDVARQVEDDNPGIPVNVDWDSDEVPVRVGDDPEWFGSWGLNGEHTAWIDFLGTRQEYKVILVDPDAVITDVAVPTLTCLSTNRELKWDDQREKDWLRIRCTPGECTLTTAEGKTYKDGLWELRDALELDLQAKYPGIQTWIDSYSSEEPMDQTDEDGNLIGNWTTGEHSQPGDWAWLDVCGKFVPYTVRVIDNPITGVQVKPITRFVTDRRRTYDETQNKSWWQVDVLPDTEVTLTLKDHEPVTGRLNVRDTNPESLYSKLKAALGLGENDDFEIEVNWGSNEEPSENGVGAYSYPWADYGDWGGSWTAGKTYENGGWVSIGGIVGTFDVKVIDNPVVKAEIPDRTIADKPENRMDDWAGVLNCPPVGTIKVWLNDGTLVTGDWTYDDEDEPTANHIETKLRAALAAKGGDLANAPVWVDWGNDEYPGHMWSHGRYTCTLWFMGKCEDASNGAFTYHVNLTNDNHHLNPVAAVAATCTAPGNIAYWLCETCNKLFADAAGTNEITLADTVIPASHANHAGGTELRNYRAATCGAEGYTGDTYCLGCGEKLSSGQAIPATGNHSWDAGVVTTPATTSAEGVRTYTCTVCGATTTQSIAKLPAPKPTLPAMKGVKVKVKKTKATVSWKKNAKAKGYQIQYSTDKTFATGVKKVNINKKKTVKYTAKKLKKKTTYYFRIRAVNGKSFSAWTVKTVKVK